MTQFRNRTAVWSSLHEPVLIYASSHWSVLGLPAYRVHDEHESGLGPGLLQRVRISPNGSESLKHATVHINKYKYTLNTLPSTLTHTCTPTYIHIYTYIRVYTYIHSSTHACVHKYKYTHTLSYMYISLYLSLIHI